MLLRARQLESTAAILGLTLLVAVQQKLCALPAPPSKPVPRTTCGSDGEAPATPEKRPPPLTLAGTLPNTALPRCADEASLRRVDRSEAPPCAQPYLPLDDFASADTATDLPSAFDVRPPVELPPGFGTAGLRRIRVADRPWLTQIQPIAPPAYIHPIP